MRIKTLFIGFGLYTLCSIAYGSPVNVDPFDVSKKVAIATDTAYADPFAAFGETELHFELNLTQLEPKSESTYFASISEPVALTLVGILLALLGTFRRKSRG